MNPALDPVQSAVLVIHKVHLKSDTFGESLAKSVRGPIVTSG